MTRLSLIAFVVAAASAATACKPESARRADRAAKDVAEKREKLVEAAKEAKPAEVLAEAAELAKAAHKFELQKSRRLATLNASQDLYSTQAGVIGVLARDMKITDAARGAINLKLTSLQTSLDETANLIEGLTKVSIDTWETRNAAVTDAMERLDDSRQQTWGALEVAPLIDPNAS